MHQMSMKTGMNTGDDRDMKNERHSHHQDDYQFLKD